MNKEEILNLNKQDNKGFDEKEKGDIVYACNKAYRIGRFLCALIVSLDGFVAKRINYSVLGLFMIMTGTYLIYMYKQFKKKLELVFGILYLIVGLLLFIKYFISLYEGKYYE